jgi:hypothetical protein
LLSPIRWLRGRHSLSQTTPDCLHSILMSKSEPEASEQRLTTEVLRSLEAEPGMDKRQLVRVVRSKGLGATPRDINRLLYRHPELFRWEPGDGAQRRWYPLPSGARANRPEDDPDTLVLSKRGRWS